MQCTCWQAAGVWNRGPGGPGMHLQALFRDLMLEQFPSTKCLAVCCAAMLLDKSASSMRSSCWWLRACGKSGAQCETCNAAHTALPVVAVTPHDWQHCVRLSCHIQWSVVCAEN
jgi:hypothetical protein